MQLNTSIEAFRRQINKFEILLLRTHTVIDILNSILLELCSQLPCSASNPGEINGICDGFGTAQCAPPFIGLWN